MSDVELYPFTIEFEEAVVLYAISDKKFFGSFSQVIETDAFPTPAAETAMELCTQHFNETGNGPASRVIFMQRLKSYYSEGGKITYDHMCDVHQYVEDAFDADTESMTDIAHQLAEIIKPRVHGAALRDALTGSNSDPSDMIRKLQTVERVGEIDSSLGTIGNNIAALMSLSSEVDSSLIPTGIPKLDSFLGGGAPRGELFVYAAETNGGKSSALSQFAVAGVREGYFVLFGTNEDPETRCRARMYGDLLDVPWVAVENNEPTPAMVKRWGELAGGWGPFIIKEFPKSATPADLDEWRKEAEAKVGRKVDLFVFDYADKLQANRTKANDYQRLGDVYDDLADIARLHQLVMATGSQVKTDDQRKVIRSNDLGDSRKKQEIARTIVSLNLNTEEMTRFIYLCKQKKGKADIMVGDVETDFTYGRYSTISPRVKNGAKPSDDWKATEVIASLGGSGLDFEA